MILPCGWIIATTHHQIMMKVCTCSLQGRSIRSAEITRPEGVEDVRRHQRRWTPGRQAAAVENQISTGSSASCTAPAVSMGGSDERFALVPVQRAGVDQQSLQRRQETSGPRSSLPAVSNDESPGRPETRWSGPGQNNSIKREAVGETDPTRGANCSRDPINTRMGLSGGRPSLRPGGVGAARQSDGQPDHVRLGGKCDDAMCSQHTLHLRQCDVTGWIGKRENQCHVMARSDDGSELRGSARCAISVR